MFQNWLEFAIYGLAIFRLSYMLVEEDGPFEMFNGLRWLTGQRWVRADASGSRLEKVSWFDMHWMDKPHWLLAIVKTPSEILNCVYCASVWVSAGFLLLHYWLPQAADVIAVWLAFSTIAIIIKEKMS